MDDVHFDDREGLRGGDWAQDRAPWPWPPHAPSAPWGPLKRAGHHGTSWLCVRRTGLLSRLWDVRPLLAGDRAVGDREEAWRHPAWPWVSWAV